MTGISIHDQKLLKKSKIKILTSKPSQESLTF